MSFSNIFNTCHTDCLLHNSLPLSTSIVHWKAVGIMKRVCGLYFYEVMTCQAAWLTGRRRGTWFSWRPGSCRTPPSWWRPSCWPAAGRPSSTRRTAPRWQGGHLRPHHPEIHVIEIEEQFRINEARILWILSFSTNYKHIIPLNEVHWFVKLLSIYNIRV